MINEVELESYRVIDRDAECDVLREMLGKACPSARTSRTERSEVEVEMEVLAAMKLAMI